MPPVCSRQCGCNLSDHGQDRPHYYWHRTATEPTPLPHPNCIPPACAPCLRGEGGVLCASSSLGSLEISDGSTMADNTAGNRGGAVYVGDMLNTVSSQWGTMAWLRAYRTAHWCVLLSQRPALGAVLANVASPSLWRLQGSTQALPVHYSHIACCCGSAARTHTQTHARTLCTHAPSHPRMTRASGVNNAILADYLTAACTIPCLIRLRPWAWHFGYYCELPIIHMTCI